MGPALICLAPEHEHARTLQELSSNKWMLEIDSFLSNPRQRIQLASCPTI